MVDLTVLTSDQYCYILDPFDEEKGVNLVGKRLLKTGPTKFFLKPQETIEGGIKAIYILTKEQALLLREIGEGESSGKQWVVQGPHAYAPPVEAEVVEERKVIILEKNQGIYVRDLEKGDVKIVKDQTYMLKAHEVLAEKIFEDRLEKLIDPSGTRDKFRAVTITLEHNEAIHIYKEKDNSSRVVLGPNVVMLEYDEHVTINILSGKTPKEEGVIKTLKIRLGPDFMSDIFKVETSNCAKLKVAISYNWQFKYDRDDQESLKKIFNVRDFVGDTCRELKSKVVAEVASRTLDEFHKNSAKLIRTAIFGMTDGKVNDEYFFPSNNLSVTNCDIKSVESLDKESQQSLREIV